MFSRDRLLIGGAALLALIGSAGCRVRASGYVEPPPPTTVSVQGSASTQAQGSGTVVVGQPTLTTGVTVVDVQCTQGATEACNGLDDNCNGQIDEGCGYSSGNIQITLSWTGRQDIDMYVVDPANEEISYQHTQSSSGGTLDHDARGNCAPGQNDTIENVFWNTPNPPRGEYRVELHYWGDCDTGGQPAATTLSIAVGGRVIGAYSYALQPNQRVAVARFQI